MTPEQVMNGPFPELEGDGLRLRELAETDDAALFEQFSDDEVTRYYDLETFSDIEEARQLLAVWRNRRGAGIGLRWAICREDAPDRLLGTCGYNLWLQRSARAVLGFDLARAHWRQGIMSRALRLVLDFGFQQMQVNRVEAVVFRDNDASSGLLTQAGFTREGVLREYEYLHGRFEDMIMFSLLRHEHSTSS